MVLSVIFNTYEGSIAMIELEKAALGDIARITGRNSQHIGG